MPTDTSPTPSPAMRTDRVGETQTKATFREKVERLERYDGTANPNGGLRVMPDGGFVLRSDVLDLLPPGGDDNGR